MAPSSSRSSKPKVAEIAAETRKHYLPMVKKSYPGTYSYLYDQPLNQLTFDANHASGISRPTFYICAGDPVDVAINWTGETGCAVAFICAANGSRPGGDWETGVLGYEERLCRRSSLAAALGTPGPQSGTITNFPIPLEGGIWSPQVIVFRGPHDTYEKLPQDEWRELAICSLPPVRWPKLTSNGKKFSFNNERDVVRNKLRGALRICLHNGYSNIVIGDFGLGSAYRNPPLELAEMWREVVLFDPDLRGRIQTVTFCFEDPAQSTSRLIIEDISKKSKHGGGSSSSSAKGKGKAKASSSSGSASSSSSSGSGGEITDFQIFSQVFSEQEVGRIVTQPDPRYGLSMITTP